MLLESYLKSKLPIGGGLEEQHGFQMNVMMLLREGFLHLWDRLVEVEQLGAHIQYGVHVQAIRRRGLGSGPASMASAVEIDLRREQPKTEGPKPERAAAADGSVPEDFFSFYPPTTEVLDREGALG